MKRPLPQQAYIDQITVFDVVATLILVSAAIGLVVVCFGAFRP